MLRNITCTGIGSQQHSEISNPSSLDGGGRPIKSQLARVRKHWLLLLLLLYFPIVRRWKTFICPCRIDSRVGTAFLETGCSPLRPSSLCLAALVLFGKPIFLAAYWRSLPLSDWGVFFARSPSLPLQQIYDCMVQCSFARYQGCQIYGLFWICWKCF